jgi:hypothetical protein
MTAARARAYARLKDVVEDRDDLFGPDDADRVMRAADAFLHAHSWSERDVSAALDDLERLAACLLRERPMHEIEPIFRMLEWIAPPDLGDGGRGAAAA